MRSLVVVRGGRLVYERYFGGTDHETLADVRSVTKSVVATLVGIALERGEIDSLDRPIGHFLDFDDFDVSAAHAEITVRHLLEMTGGFEWSENGATGYTDWIFADDHVGYLLARPVTDAPGTTFSYNSAAVHLLGVVLEGATGRSLPEYADRVLFGPLGIADRAWEPLTSGFVNGGSGLDLRPRDLARIGQLLQQEGWSGDDRIVPPAWVSEMTAPRWPTFGEAGPIDDVSYGLLWWVDLDRNAYLAWGYGGQFVYVAPELELVVVVTTEWRGVSTDIGSRELQYRALRLIVEHVVPAIR